MRMIAIAAAVLLILPAGGRAVSTSSTPEAKSGQAAHIGFPSGRDGGETMADAVLISSLPFSDTASTVGHVNDYDEICPYGGSNSPDVVYTIIPANGIWVTVDLCASQYDTKVYIFQDVVQNTIACNDDAGCGYSGYQSKLDHVYLPAGHTYYLIVDGYGGQAGTYVMTVTEEPECDIECPPGSQIEDEPWCYDGYVDHSNSGCGHNPPVFSDIPPAAPAETITLCGTSGTFLFTGMSYRDTDWFQLTLTETQTITACCTAEFPLQFMLLYTGDCADLQYVYTTAGVCEEACITRSVGPGIVWLWVGPQVFQGVPCGSDFLMTIDGYESTSPVESRTWGTVKAMYR